MDALEQKAAKAFLAKPVCVTLRAADQDGYDGGYVCYDQKREVWGRTQKEAKAAFFKTVENCEIGV